MSFLSLLLNPILFSLVTHARVSRPPPSPDPRRLSLLFLRGGPRAPALLSLRSHPRLLVAVAAKEPDLEVVEREGAVPRRAPTSVVSLRASSPTRTPGTRSSSTTAATAHAYRPRPARTTTPSRVSTVAGERGTNNRTPSRWPDGSSRVDRAMVHAIVRFFLGLMGIVCTLEHRFRSKRSLKIASTLKIAADQPAGAMAATNIDTGTRGCSGGGNNIDKGLWRRRRYRHGNVVAATTTSTRGCGGDGDINATLWWRQRRHR